MPVLVQFLRKEMWWEVRGAGGVRRGRVGRWGGRGSRGRYNAQRAVKSWWTEKVHKGWTKNISLRQKCTCFTSLSYVVFSRRQYIHLVLRHLKLMSVRLIKTIWKSGSPQIVFSDYVNVQIYVWIKISLKWQFLEAWKSDELKCQYEFHLLLKLCADCKIRI